MKVSIRVKPGSSRVRVGGVHDGALVVAVNARAVDGRATDAALAAVADALGLRRRQVTLVAGATSRTKVVELEVPHEALDSVRRRLDDLRGPVAGDTVK